MTTPWPRRGSSLGLSRYGRQVRRTRLLEEWRRLECCADGPHTRGVTRLYRRVRDLLRRETHDMLQGGPPTVELLRPVGPDIPSDERVFQVLDFCLQVGEVLLSSGEAAADSSATMTRLAHACGLATVEIDITFTSISMCCRRGRAVAPVTSMRVVRFRTTDLTRLVSVTHIVDQVVGGELALPAAEAALVKAVGGRHPYPRWLATVGWAGLAAAVALLLGGGPMIWLTAFVVTALIDRIGRLLNYWGVPPLWGGGEDGGEVVVRCEPASLVEP